MTAINYEVKLLEPRKVELQELLAQYYDYYTAEYADELAENGIVIVRTADYVKGIMRGLKGKSLHAVELMIFLHKQALSGGVLESLFVRDGIRNYLEQRQMA